MSPNTLRNFWAKRTALSLTLRDQDAATSATEQTGRFNCFLALDPVLMMIPGYFDF
jgi:hypothetical protein